jgi:dienelactone hydrolase
MFHHALGRTEGVLVLADRFRSAGHVVHLPDLFDGARFDSIEDGVAHAEAIGMDKVIERGVAAADELPADLVYIGMSLGVLPAQKLAQTRAGAAGAILLYSCVPTEFFGPWPTGVPVQIHGMDRDPIFVDEGDLDAAKALVDEVDDAELFLYPGDQHYFADSTQPAFDHDATELMISRALELLASA